MHNNSAATTLLKIGSLFSGYGGLDLAVEYVFNARTIWFSEISPVQQVFAHHWPDAPNLGDITTINWGEVEPVNILCGGFPCQDVSTVGKMTGLAPGTRSGLWSFMAEAIDQLRPELVVIENVRGLLSAPAIRATSQGDNRATSSSATLRDLEPDLWGLGNHATRPLRAIGAVVGDLADLGYDAEWVGLPASVVGAPHPRFRIFIIAHPASQDSIGERRGKRWRGDGAGDSAQGHSCAFPPGDRFNIERAAWFERMEARTRDVVAPDRRHLQRWGKYAPAIARWEHITEQEVPAPALFQEAGDPRASPRFVEWLMGLPQGWVTDPSHELSVNQKLRGLGNGVIPLQALAGIRALAAAFGQG